MLRENLDARKIKKKAGARKTGKLKGTETCLSKVFVQLLFIELKWM